MKLTKKQQEALDAYLETGTKTGAGAKLGIDRKTVRQHLKAVERKGLAPWLTPAMQPDTMQLAKTTVQYDAAGNPIQEWRRLIPQAQEMEEFVESLCERVKGKASIKTRKRLKSQQFDILAEMAIYDSHIGMYASAKETNDQDYDCEIAGNRMVETAEHLAMRFDKPGRVVVTFGGDIMHSDTRSNTTEKSGNVLDVDSRYHRVVDYAVKACYDVVQIAAKIAPCVDVVIVEGNHDWHSCVWLSRVLKAFYANCKNINIIDQPSSRKHLVFGSNLLVWSHGDGVSFQQWQQIIAAEFAPQWGRTKHRHLKMGHVHHKKRNTPMRVIAETSAGMEEMRGLLVEHLPALCSTDAWHAEKGFIGSMRAATGFEYHKQLGLISRFYQHAS